MRVIGFVALACALLTAGACAEEGDPANGGGDVEQAIPPGSYSWLVRDWGTGGTCPDSKCPDYMPSWAGEFDVAEDGTISGTGRLGLSDGDEDGSTLNPYVKPVCISGDDKDAIMPKQDVTVSGTAATEGKPTIELEFSADVERGEVHTADCPRRMGTTGEEWALLDPFLQAGQTRKAAARCAADGKEDSAEPEVLDIQGVEFEFTCW